VLDDYGLSGRFNKIHLVTKLRKDFFFDVFDFSITNREYTLSFEATSKKLILLLWLPLSTQQYFCLNEFEAIISLFLGDFDISIIRLLWYLWSVFGCFDYTWGLARWFGHDCIQR